MSCRSRAGWANTSRSRPSSAARSGIRGSSPARTPGSGRPLTTGPYQDTSALAKWYLNEEGSEDVEAFLGERGHALISELTVVEMRCLLARRRRAGDFVAEMEAYAPLGIEEVIVMPVGDRALELVEKLGTDVVPRLSKL